MYDPRKDRFDLTLGACPNDVDMPPDRCRRRFHVPDRALGGNRVGRIDKQAEARGDRHHFVQKAQPFCAQLRLHVVDAGEIAARAAEARHETGLHGVGAGGKDDRNGRSRRFGGKGR